MLSALYQSGIVRKYKSPVLYQWSSAETLATLRKSPYCTIFLQCDGKQWMSSKKNNEKGNVMKETICPFDGRPCDPACEQRYVDLPEGGCVLSDFAAAASCVIVVIAGNRKE